MLVPLVEPLKVSDEGYQLAQDNEKQKYYNLDIRLMYDVQTIKRRRGIDLEGNQIFYHNQSSIA